MVGGYFQNFIHCDEGILSTCLTIFLDSLASLQSLHSMNIDHQYILDVLYNYYYVSNHGLLDSKPYWYMYTWEQ